MTAGDDIPAGARLLALADAWDAMTVARPYGAPKIDTEAMGECRRQAGAQFDPETVDLLERVLAGRLAGAPAVRADGSR